MENKILELLEQKGSVSMNDDIFPLVEKEFEGQVIGAELYELAHQYIAFVKMTDLVDSHGRIKDNATDDDLACIESVKYKQSESETGSSVEREVKISPKLKALELLGKHLGMWNDKIDVNITQPIVITGEDALED